MGLFFNRDAAKTASNINTNSYLDDQKSLFNTKDNSQKKLLMIHLMIMYINQKIILMFLNIKHMI